MQRAHPIGCVWCTTVELYTFTTPLCLTLYSPELPVSSAFLFCLFYMISVTFVMFSVWIRVSSVCNFYGHVKKSCLDHFRYYSFTFISLLTSASEELSRLPSFPPPGIFPSWEASRDVSAASSRSYTVINSIISMELCHESVADLNKVKHVFHWHC